MVEEAEMGGKGAKFGMMRGSGVVREYGKVRPLAGDTGGEGGLCHGRGRMRGATRVTPKHYRQGSDIRIPVPVFGATGVRRNWEDHQITFMGKQAERCAGGIAKMRHLPAGLGGPTASEGRSEMGGAGGCLRDPPLRAFPSMPSLPPRLVNDVHSPGRRLLPRMDRREE
ncbi:hypothetical protein E2C01_041973 [Portunus trituberculatus]|uniref:Uncharacterized protein n=1 Tax=Portunus trituberculatus TaxID=210409 RepID=A0A5B7FV65_PORTR|nr:hypothetical protein [Portunus trituberculatus]